MGRDKVNQTRAKRGRSYDDSDDDEPKSKRRRTDHQSAVNGTSYWRRVRGSTNLYTWNHSSQPLIHLLPEGGAAAPSDLVYDPDGGYHPAPRGGGSGVQAKGIKQTVVFDPPLSPRSDSLMTDRFKNLGSFSPLRSSERDDGGNLKVTTNSGDSYQLGGVYGPMHIFHHQLPDADFLVDEYGSMASKKIPFTPLPPSASIVVTPSRLSKWGGGKRKGFSGPTQIGAMGNLTANTAAVKAGVNVSGSYQWLHLFAFTMGGLNNANPNEPNNLIVGTLEANMLHEKIEAALKQLIDKTKQPATVRYAVNVSDPTHCRFDLDWHVATEVKWQILFKNQVLFEHTIELLSHNPPRKSEKSFVNEFLQHLQEKEVKVAATTS